MSSVGQRTVKRIDEERHRGGGIAPNGIQ